MNWRLFVFWLTGRDLLKPKPQTIKYSGGYMQIQLDDNGWAPKLAFRLRIGGLTIELKQGPNCIFRFMQKIILGFKWELENNLE